MKRQVGFDEAWGRQVIDVANGISHEPWHLHAWMKGQHFFIIKQHRVPVNMDHGDTYKCPAYKINQS